MEIYPHLVCSQIPHVFITYLNTKFVQMPHIFINSYKHFKPFVNFNSSQKLYTVKQSLCNILNSQNIAGNIRNAVEICNLNTVDCFKRLLQ
jgi:hypothetical protein